MRPADKYGIPYKSLKSGSQRFVFEVGDSLLASIEGSCIKHGAAEVTVDAQKSGTSSVILDITAKGEVTVECDRCLGDLVLPVDYAGRLNVRISDEQGPYDGDIIWVSPAEDCIELGQYIYESVVLSLPLRRVHPDDESGNPSCDPDMLSRFRIVTEEEFDALGGGSSLADNPAWEKLRGTHGTTEKDNN